jgi:hypothetical protein
MMSHQTSTFSKNENFLEKKHLLHIETFPIGKSGSKNAMRLHFAGQSMTVRPIEQFVFTVFGIILNGPFTLQLQHFLKANFNSFPARGGSRRPANSFGSCAPRSTAGVFFAVLRAQYLVKM